MLYNKIMDASVFWKKVKMKLVELNQNQEWLCNKTGILLPKSTSETPYL